MMSDNLIKRRQAIQHLLDARSAADALASYYALYHPPDRTTLMVHSSKGLGERADGFLALCRTGMDLFRPLLTMKAANEEVAVQLLKTAVPPEVAVMFGVTSDLRSVIDRLFSLSDEVTAHVYRLERYDFRPIINVLVVQAPSPDGSPRFVIRGQSFDRGARPIGSTLATAGINWQSPDFAEVYVQVDAQARGRGFGKSVVSALCSWLVGQNITPLYMVPDTDSTSAQLATSLGFKDTGERILFCDGTRKAAVAFPFTQSVVE